MLEVPQRRLDQLLAAHSREVARRRLRFLAALAVFAAVACVAGRVGEGRGRRSRGLLREHSAFRPSKSVARRVVDRRVLHLIKMWLDRPVEETDDRGRKTRTTEARDKRRGIPQGSPSLPDAKGNFCFDRVIALDRSRYVLFAPQRKYVYGRCRDRPMRRRRNVSMRPTGCSRGGRAWGRLPCRCRASSQCRAVRLIDTSKRPS